MAAICGTVNLICEQVDMTDHQIGKKNKKK